MKLLPSILAALLLVGCSAVPRLRTVDSATRAAIEQQCRARFPGGSWRAVHTIHARMPLGYRSAMIGIAVGSAEQDRLRLVAMAPEGMTLLDAIHHQGRVQLVRAVPPFDRLAFVHGMLADVRMLFFAPQGKPTAVGKLKGGHAVCRWRARDGSVIDVHPRTPEQWGIKRYDPSGSLIRTAWSTGPVQQGFNDRVVLRSHGLGAYTLKLKLLRSARAPPPPRPTP
ncbi:MAG: hypothetical protein ABI333_04485 [bacterium]